MDIIESIKKRSTELTRKQYMVAKYMIDHPDEMAYITLKELSRDIGVTEITILNTCASLGYESFTQIKYEFRKDIIQKQKTDVLDDSSVYTETGPKYEHDNREKVLAEIAKQHGIEWEQKGTHEEHLDVYNFKKKERKKEVQELEQKKENLTVENEGLTSQIAEARADIKLLEEEKIQFQKDKEIAEKRAEKAETELKKLEDRREFLQPVMDNVSKEIKEYGMIKTFLPEATALERAVTYRDKKIKPLFIEMKNKIGAMAAQVKELTRERDSWKSKFQKKKQEHEKTKKELAEVQKDYQKLSGEKEILQGLADRYNRLLRMLGKDMVERLVQDDIRMQAELEVKKQKEQMPKKIGDRIQWARERSEEHNAQIKKNKAKYRGMEL